MLTEALAAERSARKQDAADTSTMQQVAHTVLEALADRLNAEPLLGWTFVLEGQQIRIARHNQGSRQQVGTWTMGNKMQLVCGEATTEWITSESFGRVLDEAVQITAKLIVETETGGATKATEHTGARGAEIVELPPRY
jgi:hypothetical protein